jgi:hypothetical protein
MCTYVWEGSIARGAAASHQQQTKKTMRVGKEGKLACHQNVKQIICGHVIKRVVKQGSHTPPHAQRLAWSVQ